jgi:hypothetical protein
MSQERRLEGQVFHTGFNNGVSALAHEAVVANFRKQNAIMNALKNLQTKEDRELIYSALDGHLPAYPIFTFVRPERFKDSPWFTGDDKLFIALTEYLKNHGARVIHQGLFVPFSNGYEVGAHGVDAQAGELCYVTSDEEFEKTFGVSIKELQKLIPQDN